MEESLLSTSNIEMVPNCGPQESLAWWVAVRPLNDTLTVIAIADSPGIFHEHGWQQLL
jgi:hypothetical protein